MTIFLAQLGGLTMNREYFTGSAKAQRERQEQDGCENGAEPLGGGGGVRSHVWELARLLTQLHLGRR